MRWYLDILIALLLCSLPPQAVQADTRLRVWFAAFIDPVHPKLQQFSTLTSAGSRVIAAPNIWAPPGFDIRGLKGTCFSTDNRSFEKSPTASARGRVDFVISFKRHGEIALQKSPGRDSMIFVGPTRNVDCLSGKDLRPPMSASSSGIKISDIKTNGPLRILNVRASIGDPFYRLLSIPIAPKLDFEFVFEYNTLGLFARMYGTTGVFPSFEGYYQLNNEPIVTFLQRRPEPDATPFSLFDMGLGVATRNFQHRIDLTSYLSR